ncbi:MAG: serine/threonine-protein kinase [Planctomycetota bacterium]|nr:serine/threonine-protein kinase [Planctomycetota bacterium]
MSESDPPNAAGRLTDFDSAQRLLSAVEDDAIVADDATTGGAAPRIPGYTIERLLGAGGGGSVYRALADASQRPVAIKLLNRRLGREDDAQRAWRELHILSQLRLPCLPQMLDYGEHEGRLYIVTEFIDGVPLDEHCRESHLDREGRVKLLAEVADAVQALHEHGVIHRDLKPGNILVNGHGQPVIVDLGIAALLADDVMETLTAEGVPLGSPAFMAPEQARGERGETSTRSDIYGLGATAYYILTGQPPHDMEATIHEAIRRVAQDEPRDARMLDRSLPRALASVLRKAVARKPADRYGSAAGFAADLRRWLNRDPVEAGTLSLVQRLARFVGRHPIVATTCTCLTIAALTLGLTKAAVWWSNERPWRIIVAPDRSWAQLVTLGGNVLRWWDAGEARLVAIARLIERPAAYGDDRVVLLGFGDSTEPEWAGQLGMVHAHDPERIIWQSGTARHKFPMPDLFSNVADGGFRLDFADVADVFPDSPGDEIIALHAHTRWSPSAIRIYNLAGDVLYEAWHDGRLYGAYWLSEAGLLILAGVNSEADWVQRGHRPPEGVKSAHPLVVFAVRPARGAVGPRCVRSTDGPGKLPAAWYKCVSPPQVAQRLRFGPAEPVLHAPKEPRPAGRFVRLNLLHHDEAGIGLSLILDADGQVVHRASSSLYRMLPDAPDPEDVKLGDLPPIVR